MIFENMGLSAPILRAVEELGYQTPTPIQEKVIPVLLEDKCDIIGLAQTGTGKTAAFGLPLLQEIDLYNSNPQLLVLSPTRELCLQITRDLENYSKYIPGMKIVSVYGGASIEAQINSIRRGVHVVVATPGRILDLVNRKKINLSGISTLVLDEADEMLKMGFREDLDAILAKTPEHKTTLLFSATMAPGIAQIARTYMHNPVEFTIGKKNSSAENVAHTYCVVRPEDRYNSLKRIVDYYPDIYGIVFCRTRQETKDVAAKLMTDSYNAEALHGDLSQAQRDSVMKKFREGHISLLVATDVAARGLDVNNLSHIINYNLPDDVEIYTHRSGRTGRAGKEGASISILNSREKSRLPQIEKVIGKKFQYQLVPTGREICERQLFNMVNRMKNSTTAHGSLNNYMELVNDMLADLSKEEIVRRFVSLEFNRFLEYYKNASDLNISQAAERPKTISSKSGNGKMSRIIFNIGKGKNITKREIIEMFNDVAGFDNVKIGQIDIFRRVSAVEVDSRSARSIINGLNQSNYKGVRIEAEENYEFTGNDFRDRTKKKKYLN
jgi:ATP-dependent RNA helicase DeaD